MYSTHNEGKPVATEKFRRVKSIKRMAAIGRKSYFGFLNKLVMNAITLIIILLG